MPPEVKDETELLRVTDDSKNLLVVEVYRESGCDVALGEYAVWITQIVNGMLDDHDYQLVWGRIAEDVDVAAFEPDTRRRYVLEETGEWESNQWHRYYIIRGQLTEEPQQPVGWPTEPGWWLMEVPDSAGHPTLVRYETQSNIVSKSNGTFYGRTLCETWQARFLPAHLPVFPPRETA